MYGSFDDERFVHTSVIPLRTIRWITLKVQVVSTRVVYVYYKETKYVTRKAYVDSGLRVYNVKCYTKACPRIECCSRFGYTPKPEVNFALRYCTYVAGAQIFINSTSVVFPITYHSDRFLYANTFPYSQRFGIFIYSVWNELYVLCCREQVVHTTSPFLNTSIKTLTERKVEFKIGDVTSRFCITVYEDISERLCLCTRKIDSILYTPQVFTAVKELSSERKICLGHSPSYGEVRLWIEVSKVTERFISIRYTLETSRFCVICVAETSVLDAFRVICARLEYTEKVCFCSSFAYMTERFCFCEDRKLYKVKTPISGSPAISIRSDAFDLTSIKLLTDRTIEFSRIEDGIVEKLDSAASSKIIIQSKRNELAISAVDNVGTAISRDVNKSKELLTGFSLILNIGFTHITERNILVGSVLYITERILFVAI